MKVISKVNTKRLVKGAVYDVVKLQASNTGQNRYFRPRVTIRLNSEINQNFSVNNFKLENGDDLPQIDWTSEHYKLNHYNWSELRITEKNIKEGDYVVYTRNSHSSLITDRKYKVEKINHRVYNSTFGNQFSEIEIKVEGSTRFYKSYSFRKCTADETRETNLKLVFDENSDLEKVDKSKRKFDYYNPEEKERILLEILFKSAIDKNRNNLSVVDWAITKIAESMKLKNEDFETILDKDLKTTLNLI